MEAKESDHLLRAKHQLPRCKSRYLGLAMFACTVGTSFSYGYNTGVINTPNTVFQNFINASSHQYTGRYINNTHNLINWTLVVSIWIVGGIFGSLAGGALADKFGRKLCLLQINVFIFGGGLLEFGSRYAGSVIMLLAGRLITGFHAGVATCVSPMYICEIAPVNLRGVLGTCSQLAMVTGCFVSQVLGLDRVLGNADRWHYLFVAVWVPAVLQVSLLYWCPESPHYTLLVKQDKDKCMQDLVKFHGGAKAGQELREIIKEGEAAQCLEKVSMCKLLRNPTFRTTFIVSIVLQFSQQLTGIRAVNYYSTSLFEYSGLGHDWAQYSTLALNIVALIMTVVSAVLVNYAGRRTLLLFGLGGQGIFAIFITVSLVLAEMVDWMKYFTLVAVVGFVSAFSVGPGTIPWFMAMELFPLAQRGSTASISVFMNWVCNFVVGLSFLFLENSLGALSFGPFIAVTILVWIYLYFHMPETKDRSIADITAQITGQPTEPRLVLAPNPGN